MLYLGNCKSCLLEQEVQVQTRQTRVPAVILAGSLLFVVLIFQLLVRVQITREGYRLERLRAAMIENDNTLRQLKYEYGRLSRSTFLEKRARSELKMETTGAIRMRRLS